MINAKKICIDQNGYLLLQRRHDTSPRAVVCPFRSGHHHCGDWCPHFGQVQHGLTSLLDPAQKYFTLDLSCGFGCRIFADEASPEPDEDAHDHLAELGRIFAPRTEKREGDEP